MNFSYMLDQAESVKNVRAQREADVRVGELAEGFARVWRSLVPARRNAARTPTGGHEAIRQSCATTA